MFAASEGCAGAAAVAAIAHGEEAESGRLIAGEALRAVHEAPGIAVEVEQCRLLPARARAPHDELGTVRRPQHVLA